jgi:hypothetical protein
MTNAESFTVGVVIAALIAAMATIFFHAGQVSLMNDCEKTGVARIHDRIVTCELRSTK